jgi:hypothetical protein
MTVNEYVKRWCDEEYDVRKEDFFVTNAYYVADREKAVGGLKHGVIVAIIAIVVYFLHFGESITADLFIALEVMGVLTVAFWFYAAQEYDANNWETSKSLAVMIATFLLWTGSRVGETVRAIFAILALTLYVKMTFVNFVRFVMSSCKMKQRLKEEEAEEEEQDKQAHAKWEGTYKAYRYGLPNSEVEVEADDPIKVEARALFNGYTDNKQMLKTRYRQLAKQYHPDKGGDTKLFQCIIETYEEFGKILVD